MNLVSTFAATRESSARRVVSCRPWVFSTKDISPCSVAGHQCDTLLMSLFVNPLQFGPTEDLSRYPHDVDRDVALAEPAGADVGFAPDLEESIRSRRPPRSALPTLPFGWTANVGPGTSRELPLWSPNCSPASNRALPRSAARTPSNSPSSGGWSPTFRSPPRWSAAPSCARWMVWRCRAETPTSTRENASGGVPFPWVDGGRRRCRRGERDGRSLEAFALGAMASAEALRPSTPNLRRNTKRPVSSNSIARPFWPSPPRSARPGSSTTSTRLGLDRSCCRPRHQAHCSQRPVQPFRGG